MPALTADDVTITLAPEDVDFTTGLRKLNLVSIAFGDGSKTYPSGGIPLPDKAKFGMSRELRFMSIAQPANGYVYSYDKANHKLRIFMSAGFTPSGTVSAHSHNITVTDGTTGNEVKLNTDHFEASGGGTVATGNAAPTFTGAAVNPAALAEATTSHAPAATTIEALVLGE